MSFKDLKELIIVNLTGVIALATSINTIFNQDTIIDNTKNIIHLIALFYWFCIAGLLICYIGVYNDENNPNRSLSLSQKVEKKYSEILIGNLIFTVIFIFTLGSYNYFLTQGLYNLAEWTLIFFNLISILVVAVIFLTISYYPLASIYLSIEEKYDIDSVISVLIYCIFITFISLMHH